MLKLPGLIDVHVHLREPGATYKEDWDTGTAAALAGGFTTVLAMPNTQPPITNPDRLKLSLDAARKKARCDYAQFLGAGPDNYEVIPGLADVSAGLKMYLDQTYGDLKLDEMSTWMKHFEHFPNHMPIAIHAEAQTVSDVITMAAIYHRKIHLCHISRRDEILVIKTAKEQGIPVTCEVTPHHLFLCEDDIPALGSGRSEVRPRLASAEDREALWDNLDVIDVFATDHAPHTKEEKDGENPPPGFPGLETAFPLLYSAVLDDRMTMEQLIDRLHHNPRRIFNLPEQPDTWIEVDETLAYEIGASEMKSRCGWTPFEGWKVQGKVNQVVLRGQVAYRDGQVLAPPGHGMNIRKTNG